MSIVVKDLGKIGGNLTVTTSDLSCYTTYELTAELERRKETKKKDFIELVRELFELGYDYETIKDIMDEA
ncbi:hypothetical protein [Bacillus albus]|uniref:hypothetical protein n=1 Tax=Bacillus albus TaxID=2026189 RepID=UPI001021ED52|nr:hypothetical protein [Bacillus albus]